MVFRNFSFVSEYTEEEANDFIAFTAERRLRAPAEGPGQLEQSEIISMMEINDKPQTVEFTRKKYRFRRANLFNDFIYSFSL